MIEYLLDTNIVSDMVRHPTGHVASRAARMGETRVGISIIVAAELRFGLVRKASARLVEQLEATLRLLPIIPLGGDSDIHYARVRADIERRGLPISANDLFIAAHALAIDATLVTDNVREFERVDGLRIENWLR